MISGTIDVDRDLEVAGGDPGIVNMTGGMIIVGDDFEIPESPEDANSIAEVNLRGGTIILDGSYEGDSHLRMYPRGTMNIRAGTLIIDGDEVSRFRDILTTAGLPPMKATARCNWIMTSRMKAKPR